MVNDILSKLIPNELRSFIDELIRKKEQDNFDRTPADLQMVIIVLKGGSQGKVGGPIMDRYQKPPLPHNSFQI